MAALNAEERKKAFQQMAAAWNDAVAVEDALRSAYEEGLREGATMASTRYGGKTWEESETKKMLDAK